MGDDDGGGALGTGSGCALRIEEQGLRGDVGHHDVRADRPRRRRGVPAGVPGRDDLALGCRADGAQCDLQRVGAVADADHVGTADEAGQVLFEPGVLDAVHVVPPAEDGEDRGLDFWL
jgi:hypothetical protein